MFKKEKDRKKNVSQDKIIDVDVSMRGDLKFSEPVNLRINGSFEGELDIKGSLTIGRNAKVKAKINGDAVIIEGMVKGDINARKSIELIPSAKVIGSIITPSLTIKEGALFKGTCDMGVENDFFEEIGVGEGFLNTREVTEYLEVDISRVRKWAQEGKIPAEKQGNNWVFNRQEIEKWLSESKMPKEDS
ncbi:MAG: polymer-forming cytoskeletal protein [Candidatus Omnitrophota bacterium]